MTESDEIRCYRHLLKDVQEMNVEDEDDKQNVLETIDAYAELGHISLEMHRSLCLLFAKRDTPSEFSC